MDMKKLLCTTAIVTAMLITQGAWAQASPSTSPTGVLAPNTLTQSTEPATQVNEGIADIVVTATRREERLQRIPVTVTAIGAADIAAAGIADVRSLTQVVPGFNGGRNQNVMQPTIRGVGSSGTGVGDESNVATYVDGVYQADPWSTQIDLVEVDRVEVLRGPQGTVFGRNATGGLVNVITPDPSFDPRGRVSARYGRMRNDASDYDLRGYLTGGLANGLAADLALLVRGNGRYIRNLVDGPDYGRTRVGSVRGKLLFKPDDIGKIVLTMNYTDAKDQSASQQPFEGNTAGRSAPGAVIPTEPWSASLSTPGVSNYKRFDVSLRTSFDLGPVLLETTGAYQRSRVHMEADSDASNIELGYFKLRVRPETLSQEVRLLSNSDGRFNWLLGGYLFYLDGTSPSEIATRASVTVPLGITRLDPKVHTSSVSGFAEGTYGLTDKFFLTAGGRYTTEQREFSQTVNGNRLAFGNAERSFDKFTYRVALRYEFATRGNVYASYGTGFKSGVFNAFGTSSTATDPETIKAAELGIKWDPTPWLRTNAAIYHYDYNDLQVTARSPQNTFVLLNAATAKIYGGELEVTLAPISGLTIKSSAVYNHAEYNRFTNAQFFFPLANGGNQISVGDASGNTLIRAPRYTFTVGANYRFDAGGPVIASANFFHSGKVYYDFRNNLSQPNYSMLGSDVAWTPGDGALTVSVYSTNILNQKVAQQIQPGPLGTYVLYERPRRLGIGAAFKF
jgi:iron complex outermembrane receptor protein